VRDGDREGVMSDEVRLMRGQCVIREDMGAYHGQDKIIVPELGDYRAAQDRRTFHRGRVLALGAPPVTKRGAEVVPEFKVGDEVIFHWEALEKAWTREWIDNEPAAWLPQQCVDAVLTRE
jgi:co-chaperonin GroES (HSP10)